jgi:uncharacterized PurR-regulated membrane protein YhhQ (DUF165 family)
MSVIDTVRRNTKTLGTVALVAYISVILAANYLTEHYGMVAVGFGLTATAGTFAAGAALLVRDMVQDTLGRAATVIGILAGAGLTWFVSPALATASAVAFLVAELADMAIYTPLRSRGWTPAVIASNVVGAIVDTFVFLHLAGFPVTAQGVEGQLVGKLLWATALPVALVVAVRQVRKPVTA